MKTNRVKLSFCISLRYERSVLKSFGSHEMGCVKIFRISHNLLVSFRDTSLSQNSFRCEPRRFQLCQYQI